MLTDFPKLECPFVRKNFLISKEHYEKVKQKTHLRSPELYLAIDEVNPGYEWVFDDPDTITVEKLDGTNVKLRTEDGRLAEVQNRLNVIDFYKVIGVSKFNLALLEGIFGAIAKSHVTNNAEMAGELIGPDLQGNPYQLTKHVWYPFERTIGSLQYKSFKKYPATFENLSAWFEWNLKSLFASKIHDTPFTDTNIFAEGVIFYNLKRKEQGLTYMAKLRRDMFDWYYDIEIIDGEVVYGTHTTREER